MMKKILFCLFLSIAVFAWNGFDVKKDDIRLLVPEIQDIAHPRTPTDVPVRLFNDSDETILATVKLHKFVDDWDVEGAVEHSAELPPHTEQTFSYKLFSNSFVYNGWYPLHVHADIKKGEKLVQLDAVRLFKSLAGSPNERFAELPTLPVITLERDDRLSLLDHLEEMAVGWQFFDKPMVYCRTGWLGYAEESRASVDVDEYTRDTAKGALALRSLYMHPPWQPEEGVVYAYFRLKLPKSDSIRLKFSHSQRTEKAHEPKSDGVTFRVSAAPEGESLQVLYDRHANVRTWMDAEVDLSAFAKKTILLRLETNPGPRRNSACDAAYWGRLILESGTEMENRVEDAGILKSWIGLKGGQFQGFDIQLDNTPLFRPDSVFRLTDYREHYGDKGAVWTYQFKGPQKTATLKIIRIDFGEDVARFSFEATGAFITSVKLGAWKTNPQRVYFGHGYVVENPRPYTLIFNGHVVAASHAAYEFEDGGALLQSIDLPPNHLVINPDANQASLVASDNCTFTFVSADDAFKAAFRFHQLDRRKPAAGYKNLAGRFIFDIWGGQNAEQLLVQLENAVRYGLTDSMATIHSWQRWGYDYRLPDVWPPNPDWGTVEQVQAIERLCREHGILWGFHDNYIDYYPDADGFTYRNIYFRRSMGDYYPGFVTFQSSNPQPDRAWYNRTREAYSYKFRPDKILPYVKRNYEAMTRHVLPTAAFVDVLAAVKPIDWYDYQGNYHTARETRQYWGEAFATIRNMLGGIAPTTSEAGNDQLIGWLDGADCQWLTLTTEPGPFYTRVDCDNWARVPWFDAVNHDKFALLGAGYSNRYQGSRSRLTHGIVSDDYLATELLAAHSLFGDTGTWGFANARKYWLAQDFIRKTATHSMVAHEFVGGDLRHQRVTWANGAVATVNRSEKDWNTGALTLPPYGFDIVYPGGRLVLSKDKGVIREYASCESHEFFNARNEGANLTTYVYDACPTAEVSYLGGNKIKYTLDWKAELPATKDYRVFLHFMTPESEPRIAFQNDHNPPVATSKWLTSCRYEQVMEIPVERLKYDMFTMTCGLFDTGSQERVHIRGQLFDNGAVKLGVLRLKRDAQGQIADVTFEPGGTDDYDVMLCNLNPARTMVDFGDVQTTGAFKLVPRDNNSLQLVPVPGQAVFTVQLDLERYLPEIENLNITAEPLREGDKPVFSFKYQNKKLLLAIDPEKLFALEIEGLQDGETAP